MIYGDNEEFIEIYIRNKMVLNDKNVVKHTVVNNNKLRHRNVFGNIIKYVDKFLTEDAYHRIITLSGLRGVGKTTLLFQVYKYLLENGVNKEEILYLDAEELMGMPNVTILDTIKVFIENVHGAYPILNKKLFVFVDESQYNPKWAKAAKIIYDNYFDVFMIFAGSTTIDDETTTDAVRRIKRIPVYPMSFSEYIYLKYGVKLPSIKEELNRVLFTGQLGSIKEIENDVWFNKLSQLNVNPQQIWKEYVKYGGFAYGLMADECDIIETSIYMFNKMVEKDMRIIKDFTLKTELNAKKLIKLLAMQNSGYISTNKLAVMLNTSTSQIKIMLQLLEKSHILQHIEPYGSVMKRNRKSWKYYFLSPTIKFALNKHYGLTQETEEQMMESLSEDLVTSILYFKKLEQGSFDLTYESGKGGVDLMLSFIDGKKIPVEVGYGKKSLKQVYNSIERNNSPYGILISNKTASIKKKDDIICIPLMFFSM